MRLQTLFFHLLLFLLVPAFLSSNPATITLLDWQGYFVITLLLGVVFLLISGFFPPDLTLLLGGMLPAIVGIVPAKTLLYSFANETIITIIMLFIVARSFQKVGLIKWVAKRALPKKKGHKRELLSILPPLSTLSAFFNNTPLVVLLTPIFRRWALENKLLPSKYLIPLSYATILGGTCTLIGTSTNLVVNGLLYETSPQLVFGFFELAKMGIPIVFLGLIYLILFSDKLLPKREDPSNSLSQEKNNRSFLAELIIPADSTFVGRKVSMRYFHTHFGGELFSIYRDGKRVEGNLEDTEFCVGDTLLISANRDLDLEIESRSRDFYLLKSKDEEESFHPKKALFVFTVTLFMIVLASFGLSMMIASMIAAFILIATKMVSGSGIVKTIDWNLLILIAGGLALSSALQVTGVAHFIGSALFSYVGDNPYLVVALVYILTSVVTEFITNTAAVMIVFPIALAGLQSLGIDAPNAIKAVAITMAISGSCSFITPIGYQTNTIVYGAGGYQFSDFFKIGVPLNLMIWLLSSLLIPVYYPF